jgi:hypothetical protein
MFKAVQAREAPICTAELFSLFTVKTFKSKYMAVEAGNNTDGGMTEKSMRLAEGKKNS